MKTEQLQDSKERRVGGTTNDEQRDDATMDEEVIQQTLLLLLMYVSSVDTHTFPRHPILLQQDALLSLQ